MSIPSVTEEEVRSLYAELAQRASARDWSDDVTIAVSALLSQPTSVLISRLSINSNRIDGSVANLSRDGDVVMGFYLDQDAPSSCEVTVGIGGVPVRGCPMTTLHPGKMTPFFGDAASPMDFFPIIAICYSETHVFGDPEVLRHASVVYGLLPTAARRRIAGSTHALPRGAVVRDGHFGYYS